MPRREPRVALHKPAKFATPDLASLEDCEVADLSKSGARLILRQGYAVPESLYLVFMAERLVRPADVRWRQGPVVGVEFTGPPIKLDLVPA